MKRGMDVKTHKDLEIWKIAVELVVKIYSLTKLFPENEKYGLASQMQRACRGHRFPYQQT